MTDADTYESETYRDHYPWFVRATYALIPLLFTLLAVLFLWRQLGVLL